MKAGQVVKVLYKGQVKSAIVKKTRANKKNIFIIWIFSGEKLYSIWRRKSWII
jgi:hypothetical protein